MTNHRKAILMHWGSRLIVVAVVFGTILWGSIHFATEPDAALSTVHQQATFPLIFHGVAGGHSFNVYRGTIDGKDCLLTLSGAHGIGISCNWSSK